MSIKYISRWVLDPLEGLLRRYYFRGNEPTASTIYCRMNRFTSHYGHIHRPFLGQWARGPIYGFTLHIYRFGVGVSERLKTVADGTRLMHVFTEV